MVTIRVRAGTAAAWTAANPVLASGEIGYEADTYKIKIGDGATAWGSRGYFSPAPGAHTHDAADITSGTFADARIAQSNVTQHQAALAIATSQLTGTIDASQIANNAVDNAKIRDSAALSVIGRSANSSGDPADIAAGTDGHVLRRSGAALEFGTLASGAFADDTINISRLQYVSGPHVFGRSAGTLGAASALTMATLRTMLAMPAADVSYSNTTSGLAATTVQAAIDEVDAAVDVLAGGAGTITMLDLAGAATANLPSSASSGRRYIIVNAHANGTVLGSSNQITVDTNDILLAVATTPSTTNGADWHKIDTTDKVVSVAGKIGAVTLAAGDIASGTFADARIAPSNVTQHQDALEIATSQLTGTIGTSQLANNAVDNTKLRDSAALSVIGRSANSTGDPADIAAGTDGHVLRRSGTTLGFGTLASGAFADDSINISRLQYVAGPHVFGRSAGTLGAASALTMAALADMVQADLVIAGSQLTGTINGGAP